MAQVFQAPQAELDLLEIWLFIAEDNEPAADRLIRRIAARCEELAEDPKIGRERIELGQSVRSWPVSNYLVFYRPRPDGIELLRVLHGARDLEALFEDDTED
jgi:toxin ParE1/3/4